MLVTDVGDEMRWWHFQDVGDSHVGLAISVTSILYLLTLALGTNIQKMSPRS